VKLFEGKNRAVRYHERYRISCSFEYLPLRALIRIILNYGRTQISLRPNRTLRQRTPQSFHCPRVVLRTVRESEGETRCVPAWWTRRRTRAQLSSLLRS